VALELDPRSGETYHHRGLAYLFGPKDYARARTDFSQAKRRDPDSVRSLLEVHRGMAEAGAGNTGTALLHFDEYLRKNRRYGGAYYEKARIFQARGEHDRAIADFTAALKWAPELYGIHYWRAQSHFARGAYLEAVYDWVLYLVKPRS
jgi:tetratricopeptide (TPR) repeat protein